MMTTKQARFLLEKIIERIPSVFEQKLKEQPNKPDQALADTFDKFESLTRSFVWNSYDVNKLLFIFAPDDEEEVKEIEEVEENKKED